MNTELDIAKGRILELEEQLRILNSTAPNRCILVEIDNDSLQTCIEMYKSGEKLTAIKWLIEEANKDKYNFGIKWAREYFEKLGL